MTEDPHPGFLGSFRAAARDDAERIFARWRGRAITFGWLDRSSDAVAAGLRARGVSPGERVAVMLHNGPAALLMAYALAKLGAVWTPLNPSQAGEALASTLANAEPGLAVVDQTFVGRIRDTWPRREAERILGVAADDGEDLLRTLGGPGPMIADDPEPDPATPFILIYTSGTTGRPKGAIVTHRMMRLAAEGVLLGASAGDGDVMFMWEPLYHIGGAQMIAVPALRRITLAMAASFDAGAFWAQVKTAGATHIHYLGGILRILSALPPGPLDRTHGARIGWGGGCTSDIAPGFQRRFGISLREEYGLTEAASISTFSTGDYDGSVGRPAPWNTIDIEDPSGARLPPGESGEIVIRGRGEDYFAGYFRDPYTTGRVIRDGALHTGDRGRRDDDGRIFFEGRMVDVFRCRGENVSAWEVETIGATHPGVADCALTGAPGEYGDQDLVLTVQAKPGEAIDLPALAVWLAERLAPHQRPRYFRLTDRFERTASQRIIKHRLPSATGDCWDRFGALAGAEREGSILEIVARAWARVLRGAAPPALSFRDSHGDSLAFLKLIFLIEEATGLYLPLDHCHMDMTANDLAALLGPGGRLEAPNRWASAERGPTLVLFAGAGGDSPLLAGVRAAVTTSARVLTPTYPDWREIVLTGMTAEGLLDRLGAQLHDSGAGRSLHLAGFSLGGALAYGVAQSLVSRGYGIAGVTIIDGGVGEVAWRPSPWRLWKRASRRRVLNAAGRFLPRPASGRIGRRARDTSPLEDLRNGLVSRAIGVLAAPAARGCLRKMAATSWHGVPPGLAYHLHNRLNQHFHGRLTHDLMSSRRTWDPLNAPVTLFRSEAHPPEAPGDLGWATHGVRPRIVALRGSHFGVLRGENLEIVAAHLSAAAGLALSSSPV